MALFPSQRISLKQAAINGLGVALCLIACGYSALLFDAKMLIPAFGATAFAAISMANAPISSPVNILGGYLVVTLTTFAAKFLLPHELYSLGVCVGVAGFFMLLLRVPHPPAAGVPITIFFMEPRPDYDFLLFPVMVGALIIIIIARIFNKIIARI